MFISDKVVFIELHKTACTHIKKILEAEIGGQSVGVHNPAGEELIASGRRFLGSIRNPWNWYLSLWGYGCDGKGTLYHATTRDRYTFRSSGIFKNPISRMKVLLEERSRHPQEWQRVYADVQDGGCFRAWLQMVCDPDNFSDWGMEFPNSEIKDSCGLLTHRYIHLFCHKFPWTTAVDNLNEAIEESFYIDHIIRAENLEEELIQALESSKVYLDAQTKTAIASAGKTNTSSKKRKLNHYYDPICRELVAKKEFYIIGKYHYGYPG